MGSFDSFLPVLILRFSLDSLGQRNSVPDEESLCSEGLTHGRVVGVWEALVHPLPHEHPAVVGEGALDDLVVILLQIFGDLRGQIGSDG